MDTRIPPARPDVVTVPSESRPTPTGTKFSDVLASGATSIVEGAESAMTVLPGAPLMALAVRGGSAPAMPMGLSPPLGPTGMGAPSGLGGGMATPLAAEGPGAGGSSAAGAALAGGMSSALLGDGGIQASLMQSQQMNLYFIQVQQQVDAQNRTFTTLSNVLKTENDTVKNAIGNIH
jgi:hypothetical protein